MNCAEGIKTQMPAKPKGFQQTKRESIPALCRKSLAGISWRWSVDRQCSGIALGSFPSMLWYDLEHSQTPLHGSRSQASVCPETMVTVTLKRDQSTQSIFLKKAFCWWDKTTWHWKDRYNLKCFWAGTHLSDTTATPKVSRYQVILWPATVLHIYCDDANEF